MCFLNELHGQIIRVENYMNTSRTLLNMYYFFLQRYNSENILSS